MTTVTDYLEPAALADTTIEHDRELILQTSIAISLKRIADVVTGDVSMGAYAFTEAAYQAGQAFERGRR